MWWPFKKKRGPNPRQTEARTGGQPMHVNPNKRVLKRRNEARMERLRVHAAKLAAAGRDPAPFMQELARREAGRPKAPKMTEADNG